MSQEDLENILGHKRYGNLNLHEMDFKLKVKWRRQNKHSVVDNNCIRAQRLETYMGRSGEKSSG